MTFKKLKRFEKLDFAPVKIRIIVCMTFPSSCLLGIRIVISMTFPTSYYLLAENLHSNLYDAFQRSAIALEKICIVTCIMLLRDLKLRFII